MSYQLWTPTEDSLLRELVATKKYSYRQMASHFPGRSGISLMKRARNYLDLSHNDFVLHKYTYNQHFFAVPNPINCYVAGYYAADGCITDNPTTRVLAMSLSHQEWHQLETFKKLMEYSGPVVDDSYPYRPNMCALRLYSAYQLAEDLERNFGITKGKTFRLPPPNITDPHLQLCYLAGLLDGDGCVHIANTGMLMISYASASKMIVDWVKGFIDSLNLHTFKRGRHFTIRKDPNSAAYIFAVAGAKAVDLVHRIQALKKEGIPILDRKWDNERLNTYIRAFEEKHQISSSPS